LSCSDLSRRGENRTAMARSLLPAQTTIEARRQQSLCCQRTGLRANRAVVLA